jgi:cobyrinic acid a,c-diamide synthase
VGLYHPGMACGSCQTEPERTVPSLPRRRIAITGGPAFTFGYAEHLELLDAAGAEVVRFDPLRDEQLPDGVDGLVIGGGFPEEHAADLSANVRLRAQVAALAQAGAPVIAKCAGLLYLARSLDGHPMCRVLDASAAMTGRLTLGYRDAVAAAPSPLAQPGHACPATSFTAPPSVPRWATAAWHWRHSGAPVPKVSSAAAYMPPICTHWNGIPGAAARITAAARAYREARSHG